MADVKRIYVEKKNGFNVEAVNLLQNLKETLHIDTIQSLRIVNAYDLQGVDPEDLDVIANQVLAEPNTDHVHMDLPAQASAMTFRVALLPGQFDQRADSASQCIQLVTLKEKPMVGASKIYMIDGDLSADQQDKIKKYLINPIESCEVSMDIPADLDLSIEAPTTVEVLEGFINKTPEQMADYGASHGFAMATGDLLHIQDYYKNQEKRNPTITELKVIDTYWSDHCRHTTFMTELTDITFEAGAYTKRMKETFETYTNIRTALERNHKPVCLMDLATIQMKQQLADGRLADMEVTEEINACSIEVPVETTEGTVPYLIMFKNETHNHPTEIEPYGGASTCLGGAIRDPLSGRSYVYQSMRLTGAADPRTPIEDTLPGKLPQRKITTEAAQGFSAYGNQIGLATGMVKEVYDPGFLAKRMEVGAVVGAAPKANVTRKSPETGDIILMVGGPTGRDGCGGATGSSKVQTEDSIHTAGAEVQKGNPPMERKLQRLFRNPKASVLIKKSNDFGAGGVSVAIGELADSIDIQLDVVPVKYQGLDGTELAISESQERMAVVLDPADVPAFMAFAEEENLECVHVATVTDSGRLRMFWKGQAIFDIRRDFLETNGVRGTMAVTVTEPMETSWFQTQNQQSGTIKEKFQSVVSDLNIASQKGLVECFDSTIGTGSVLMPFGGQRQMTPAQGMAAKVPVLGADTTTGTVMTFGYDPAIGKWSPYHGGYYAVVESVAKAVAMGADFHALRLSMQEYFERLGDQAEKWGKPFAALLGALEAQEGFGIPAIGGKDSMSGTFKDINVPPTAISFALAPVDVRHVISSELKTAGNKLVLFHAKRDREELLNFDNLRVSYDMITEQIEAGTIKSAWAIGRGGLSEAVTLMGLGNQLGVELTDKASDKLFEPAIGSILFECDPSLEIAEGFVEVGTVIQAAEVRIGTEVLKQEDLEDQWTAPLESIFPSTAEVNVPLEPVAYTGGPSVKIGGRKVKPTVFVPVFPGTNCEYDTIRAFEDAGASVESIVFKNGSAKDVEASIEAYVKAIEAAKIVALPGGFSAGDEPDGSGKFIASILRNPRMTAAVHDLLNKQDGLMIGICNGFQALIKLGLLPYGDIRPLEETDPTLALNTIGRHVSCLADVKAVSNLSPWMQGAKVNDVYRTAFSHGEGRFVCNEDWFKKLSAAGQIATQYVDPAGNPSLDGRYNINGSMYAIEGITNPDGRILGKMGHVERIGENLYKNVPGQVDMKIFQSGVKYFD